MNQHIFIHDYISRGHIESLPEIINEIWAVMGESGEAVRKSLVWIIETVSFFSLLQIFIPIEFFIR